MKHSILGTACASFLVLASGVAQAVAVSGQGTWETTLQGRDLDGNFGNGFEAYYDTSMNITWLADANYAMTSGYDDDGRMDWATANAWAASLNPYGSGITGWQLPHITESGITYCTSDCGYYQDTTFSPMTHMFYVTLGNTALYTRAYQGPQEGWGLSNTGPFTNIQQIGYWSATQYSNERWFYELTGAVYFDFETGEQDVASYPQHYYSWAIHAGDVGAATVPLPAAMWLLGSGLLGLLGMSRKRQC